VRKLFTIAVLSLGVAATLAFAEGQTPGEQATTTFPTTNAYFNTANGDIVVANGEQTVSTQVVTQNDPAT
jgi:hypothetical protein